MGGYAWTEDEEHTLGVLWPWAARDEIEESLPKRRWKNIGKHASELGLRRLTRPCKRETHPLMKRLRRLRMERQIRGADLAKKIGYHTVQLRRWETGADMPSLFGLLCWCDALNVSLEIVQRKAHVEVTANGKPPGVRRPSLAKMMAGR